MNPSEKKGCGKIFVYELNGDFISTTCGNVAGDLCPECSKQDEFCAKCGFNKEVHNHLKTCKQFKSKRISMDIPKNHSPQSPYQQGAKQGRDVDLPVKEASTEGTSNSKQETLSPEQKKRKAEYQKKYQKEHPEYQAKKVREYAHRNKDKIREKGKKSYSKDKTKALARAKTNYSNEKTGSCFDCKKKRKTEFHHLSYEPNIFIEVCRICHNKRPGRNTWIV